MLRQLNLLIGAINKPFTEGLPFYPYGPFNTQIYHLNSLKLEHLKIKKIKISKLEKTRKLRFEGSKLLSQKF